MKIRREVPDPRNYSDWRAWAEAFAREANKTNIGGRTAPEPVLLATVDQSRDASAGVSGLLLYHPVHGLVISRNGTWYKATLTGPVTL